MAEYLATRGASPEGSLCSCPSVGGDSAFHIAARHNLPKLFSALLQHHPLQFLNLKQPVHPFHIAMSEISLSCAELMVRWMKESSKYPYITCHVHADDYSRKSS